MQTNDNNNIKKHNYTIKEIKHWTNKHNRLQGYLGHLFAYSSIQAIVSRADEIYM